MSLDPTHAALTAPSPNGRIVELGNEVKDKTKKILIYKINSKTTAAEPRKELELVGSLCDSIERIWAHGAHSVTSQEATLAFSPLWSHLLVFIRLKYLDTRPKSSEFTDGSHLNILAPSKCADGKSELDAQVQSSFLSVFERHKPSKKSINDEKTKLLIDDLLDIWKLSDVKTDVGRARAFLRLSLERKRLSQHVKTLLSDSALLRSLYKPYAFLRCEDELEKFLMYLSTLNAFDLRCYTTTFVSVIETRRLKAATSGGSMMSSVGK